MSVHVSSWAWKQIVGDEGAKLVLLKLADNANDQGLAFPGKSTLQVECEIGHEDTVKRRLRRLRDLELAIPVPWYGADGRQTSSMYVLPFKGMPSAERLWQLLDQAPRKGQPGEITRDGLLAVEAVGAFLRGGASVHPLDLVRGGAVESPPGGAPVPPSIEEPSFEPTEELRSSLGESGSDRQARRLQIELRLTAALGVRAGDMTASEKSRWGVLVDELVEVGATPEDVGARCDAYREKWPSLALTVRALVNNWSALGADVEIARPNGFDVWLVTAPRMFDRQQAHDVIDDTAHLDEAERARRHRLLDERFDVSESEAA